MPTLELQASPATSVSAEALNEEFEYLDPEERISRSVELFAGRVVVLTTLKPTSAALLEAARRADPDLTWVNIRTHHETLDTAELVSHLERRPDTNLRVFDAEPLSKPPEGSPAFAEFQYETKVAPVQRMIDTLAPLAILSGAMSWQSEERADWPIVEDQGAVLSIRPVIDLSQAEALEIAAKTDLQLPKHYFDPAKGVGQNLECGLNTARYESNGPSPE